MKQEEIERFLNLFDIHPVSECWEWKAFRNPSGYPKFSHASVSQLAHRWAFTYFVGPIPPRCELDHRCRNRCCVNPLHLQPVSHDENMERAKPFRRSLPTHCKEGHPFSGSNLYVSPVDAHGRTRRDCKICRERNARKFADKPRANPQKPN